MSSRINVLAIITPSPGKIEQIIEEMQKVAEHAHTHEPGTLKYEMSRLPNKETGVEEIYLSEIYADNAAVKAHMASKPLAAFNVLAKKENLLAKPLQIKVLKVVGGFSRL